MKAYRENRGTGPLIVTPVLDRGEVSTSRPLPL